MMLANNTSIRHIFEGQRKDYNHLMSRKAHTFKYEQTKPFGGKLDEFTESEECVRSLIEEYAAAEHDNYVMWGQQGSSPQTQ
jgi:tubulin gamma